MSFLKRLKKPEPPAKTKPEYIVGFKNVQIVDTDGNVAKLPDPSTWTAEFDFPGTAPAELGVDFAATLDSTAAVSYDAAGNITEIEVYITTANYYKDYEDK